METHELTHRVFCFDFKFEIRYRLAESYLADTEGLVSDGDEATEQV